MRRKITSVLLILMFGSILATPLFPIDDCDMICCTSDSGSPLMLQLKEECTQTMSAECQFVIFLPVLNGPAAKFTIEPMANVSISILDVTPTMTDEEFIVEEFFLSEHAPPLYNLPILI